MTSFDFLWKLLDEHGVIERYKGDCLDLWNTLTLDQQRATYRSIRNKLQAGKFVHYDPVKAIQDNVPKVQIISAEEYYRRYGTQANQEGWVRTFLKDRQETIYVKQILN